MKRQQSILLPLIFALLLPISARAQQPWSGIISPSRATDWTGAGVVGGIPSATWTQCGSTVPAGASTPTIQAAINACGTNQFVLLAPGTYSLTAGIRMKANMVLRGSGANSTFLVATADAYDACSGGYHTAICFIGPAAGYWVTDPAVNWTAGFAQGSTQITLSSTTGITPNSTVIGLDQCADGYSGSPCSGTEIDNLQFFDCNQAYSTSGPSGCAVNGPDGGNQRLNRPQNELFQVSAVNSATGVVSLKGSLRNPNWNIARTPQAFIIQPIQNAGVENLSVDTSASSVSSGATRGIVSYYAANIWVKGVRIVRPNYSGIQFIATTHATAEQNYIYETNHQGSGADIFGMNSTASSDLLYQNNIVQGEQVCMGVEGADTGSVYGYNLCINDFNNNDGIYPATFPHAGDHYQLYEGNVQNSYFGENFHGPKLMNTNFRNFITGWESCANGNCGSFSAKDSATTAYRTVAYSRYHNAVGNVFGTPGYHTSYQTTAAFASANIYELGSGNGSIPVDPIVGTTFLRWGNYDTVTDAVRFCGNSSDTGWSTGCAGTSEVATAAPSYPNTVPTVGDTAIGQSAMPPSFYLSSKPAWFGALPFPSIGPDVTSGNVGQCSGTLNAPGKFNGLAATSASQCAGSGLTTPAWGGHVNATPAMNCFLNVMGGLPDGTGSLLPFDASSCYPGGVVTSGGPNPPANLTLTVSPD
jgi:hypothetical protein